MRAAVQAAVSSLSAGRTTKQRVVVQRPHRIVLPGQHPGRHRQGPRRRPGDLLRLRVRRRRIDRVDIANTGNNAVLIENCYGGSLATNGGTISGGGEVRLAERSEFPGNRDITLRNFTLVNNRIIENPCADNLTISNVALSNATITRC